MAGTGVRIVAVFTAVMAIFAGADAAPTLENPVPRDRAATHGPMRGYAPCAASRGDGPADDGNDATATAAAAAAPWPPAVTAWAALVDADLGDDGGGGGLDASFLYGCVPFETATPAMLALATLLAALHADYEVEAEPAAAAIGTSAARTSPFETARARTIAAFQHVTLHELAPLLLGHTAAAAASGAAPYGAARDARPATARSACSGVRLGGAPGQVTTSASAASASSASQLVQAWPSVAPGWTPPSAAARALARALLALPSPATTAAAAATPTLPTSMAAAFDRCLWEARRADRYWYEWHGAANASALRSATAATLLGVPLVGGRGSASAAAAAVSRSGTTTATDETTAEEYGPSPCQCPCPCPCQCASESWLAVGLAGVAALALLGLFFIFLAQRPPH